MTDEGEKPPQKEGITMKPPRTRRMILAWGCIGPYPLPGSSDDFCICVHVHNALCRASPISTRKQLMKTRAPRLSVNALYRASPISTHLKLSRRPHPLCVNALYRASPISTPTPTPEPEDPEVCQCPISGFSHFYDPVDPEPTPDPVVSMPYIGLLPFLRA